MTFSMHVEIKIEAEGPEEEQRAAELTRAWNELIVLQSRELELPVTLDDSLGRDLGAVLYQNLQEFIQLKRRAVARLARK